MSNIKEFNGGLNIRKAPQLLAPQDSIVYTNCDNVDGTLRPTLGPVPTDTQAWKRWKYFSFCDIIVGSDEMLYWVEHNQKMYESGGDRLQQIDCSGARVNVGISSPDDKLELEVQEGGELCGTYSYVYTYVGLDGVESAPNPLSDEVTIEEVTTGGPTDPVEPDVDDQEDVRFWNLGNKLSGIITSDSTNEEAVEMLNCAVTHEEAYTKPEYVTFISDMIGYYRASGSANDKYNMYVCGYDGMLPLHDIHRSFFNIVERASGVVLSDISAEDRVNRIGCILSGIQLGVDYYSRGYDDIANSMLDSMQAVPPADAYLDGDEWRIAQLRCLLFGIDYKPTIEKEVVVDEPIVVTCAGKILLTNIMASPDSQVTSINIYRIGGTLTHYSLVAELTNADQTYLDNSSDTSIASGNVLDSFTNGIAPTGLKYISEGHAMLFGAVGTRLYFSEVGKPHAWPASNFLEFDTELTGIGMVQNGLLVFTRYKTYIVVGNEPLAMTRFLISGEQGCVNHDTIAFSENALFWLSTDGVCASSGGKVTIVTQDRMGILQIEDSINAEVFDRMYFLGYGEGTLILDHRYHPTIRMLDYTGWFGDFKDKLYREHSGVLEEMFSGVPDELHYISPIFSEGRLSEYKSFNDIYVTTQGEMECRILVYTHDGEDGTLIFEDDLDMSHSQHDLKTRHNLEAYGIQFEFRGIGRVLEVDFAAAGREK